MPQFDWPEPVVTLEEWRRLYKAAEAFKAAAPWNWMVEEQLFAVENPETGQVGFCSITGEIGEHRALIVYLGEDGLGQYFTALKGMRLAASLLEDREYGMMLLETPQLQASFEPREFLSALDWQVVKDAKVRVRGRELWPVFRVFAPARMPWYLTGPQARFLTLLLEQALIVTQAQARRDISVDIPDMATLPATLPLLVRTATGETWTSTQRVFSPQYPAMLHDSSMSSEDLAAFRRKWPLRDVDLQVHLVMHTVPVEEGPMPPYFPYLLLAVDAEQGFVTGAELVLAHPTMADLWRQVLPKLLSVFERMGMRPKQMQIASDRLYNWLAAPVGQLGIKMLRVPQMPALEDALLAFESWTDQQR